MPGGLSQRAALLLVALAFGVAFAVRALPLGSSTDPAVERGAAGLVARDLQLAAAGTVPALRQPRKPRARTRERARRVAPSSPVTPAPTVAPEPAAPTATPQPTAVPTPRYVPPTATAAPRYVPPPPTPAPTAAPPSGEFDTTGEGELDTTNEP